MSEADREGDRPPAAGRSRRAACWRAVAIVLAALVVLAVAAELVCRFALGLGDPPLYVADPQIEYLPAPSRQYRRFGRHIAYNRWSMRSGELSPSRQNPDEARILFLGDSVINGGSLTDQAELATELLRPRLAERLGRPVVVGNASAGSWGPPNLLAYVQRFGLFDADVVVIVLNGDDASDVPTGEPVVGHNPAYPARAPALALQEAVQRYALGRLWRRDERGPPAHDARQRALAALAELIERCREHGARVIVVLHSRRSELAGPPGEGYVLLRQTAEAAGADVVELRDAMAAALRAGRSPYRDDLHPNPAGQRVLADALLEPIAAGVAR